MQFETVPLVNQSVLLSSSQASVSVLPNQALKRTCLPCHVCSSDPASSRGSQAA